MLETREERVRLLKAGILGNKIEELYISGNNFKILNQAILFETPIKIFAFHKSGVRFSPPVPYFQDQ